VTAHGARRTDLSLDSDLYLYLHLYLPPLSKTADGAMTCVLSVSQVCTGRVLPGGPMLTRRECVALTDYLATGPRGSVRGAGGTPPPAGRHGPTP
jgi:hypothetical protein